MLEIHNVSSKLVNHFLSKKSPVILNPLYFLQDILYRKFYPRMIAVIDTGFLIERQMSDQKITKGYVTDSVVRELRTTGSREYLDLFSFIVEIRNPKDEYLTRVKEDLNSKIHNLSDTDIDVVALTLELKDETAEKWIGPENPEQMDVYCLTYDNGIRNVLLHYDSHEGSDFTKKAFKLRCYSCHSLFAEKMDFCKNCGHSTLTRVTAKETENGEEIFLRKTYNYRPRILKDNRGVELRSADQREYAHYQRMLSSRKKKDQAALSKKFLY